MARDATSDDLTMVYKFNPPPVDRALGVHKVFGEPRTIGTDGMGNLAVWYEAPPETLPMIEVEFQILWTGMALYHGFKLISTTNHNGFIWHLAVKG